MAIFRAIGWLAALAATAAAWGSRRSDADPFSGLTVVRDVAFRDADGRSLKLDLLLPETSDDPMPLLVAVHGGSWTGGSRREYAPQFADLARSGLAVAVIDYRLARPGAPSWDGTLQDVKAALDWLLDRADRFRIDPRRIAMFGTSAGGTLAARAAQGDARVAAAVCLATPSSLAALAAERRLEHEPVRTFLGVDPSTNPDVASAASPIDHVGRGGPATLSIHGGDDVWVPAKQARDMHEKLSAAGVANRLLIIPGVRHGFELKIGPPVTRDLAPDVRDFLNAAWAATARDGRR